MLGLPALGAAAAPRVVCAVRRAGRQSLAAAAREARRGRTGALTLDPQERKSRVSAACRLTLDLQKRSCPGRPTGSRPGLKYTARAILSEESLSATPALISLLFHLIYI